MAEARAPNPSCVADTRHRRRRWTHYAALIATLPASPVLIGHSFGGLITQKLLGQGIGAAGVAIDPAQIKGVLPLPLSPLRAGLPALGNPANLHKAVSLTAEAVPLRLRQRALRGGVRRAVRALDHPRRPARPLFQAAAANFTLHSAGQGRHRQRGPRTAAADHRRPRTTRCRTR